MPYVNKPRPYEKEWNQEKKRNEKDARAQRAKLRRKLDKDGVDRKGKDISHKKALARGGSNSDGWKLESPSKNRARGGAMSKPPKKKKS